VEFNVKMTAPESLVPTPGRRWKARTVDTVHDSSDGATGEFVIFTVQVNKRLHIFSYFLLLVGLDVVL
jgi:hypothetical protein